MSTTAVSSTDNESHSSASTPTQRRPYPYNHSLSPSPIPSLNHADNAFDPEHLAHLLDPKRKESRAKARMLTHHLTARRVTTRSQYCQIQYIVSTKSLTSTRYRPHTINSTSSTYPLHRPFIPRRRSPITRIAHPISTIKFLSSENRRQLA